MSSISLFVLAEIGRIPPGITVAGSIVTRDGDTGLRN